MMHGSTKLKKKNGICICIYIYIYIHTKKTTRRHIPERDYCPNKLLRLRCTKCVFFSMQSFKIEMEKAGELCEISSKAVLA